MDRLLWIVDHKDGFHQDAIVSYKVNENIQWQCNYAKEKTICANVSY